MSCKHNKKIFVEQRIKGDYLLRCVQCKKDFRWSVKLGFYDFDVTAKQLLEDFNEYQKTT